MKQEKQVVGQVLPKIVQEDLPMVSFDEFEVPTYEEWQKAVEGLLKGKPFEKSMFTKTYEDILLKPIYRLEDQEGITHSHTYPGLGDKLRGSTIGGYSVKPWIIAQRCDAKTVAEAQQMAFHELEKGSTAVSIQFDTVTCKGLDPSEKNIGQFADTGVSVSSVTDFINLLKELDLKKNEIELRAGSTAIPFLAAVAAAAPKICLEIAHLHGLIGADPIGILAQEGELSRPLDELYDDMAHSIYWAEENAPGLRTVLVDTDVYHNGGANGVQEAAYAIQTALTYMRAMERRGIAADVFCRHLRFHFSVGANFFMEIAKLRSVKMLWSQVVKQCGCSDDVQGMNLFVSTSGFCQTVYDPYVNLLRAATQSFSAVVGGIDGMYVRPFDAPIRPSDEFSRRIARNIQIMEQHEFNFMKPIDPAGGSWYLESLTEEFTEKAWKLFQELEAKDGILACLMSGELQEAVEKVLLSRFKQLATRQDRAVGNNMYPDMTEERLTAPSIDYKEMLADRLEIIASHKEFREEAICKEFLQKLAETDFAEPGSLVEEVRAGLEKGLTIGEITKALGGAQSGESVVAIGSHRWTEQYEALRQCTEEYKSKTGDNVKIFLANMGPIPQHKARADFVTSFMQVAAFDVALNNGFATVDEAVQAALDSGADVAIVCSTDATYPELAPAVTKGIKAIKPDMKVFLAGAPSAELKELCDAAGMDDYISVRSNCYETLLQMQREKGMIS